MRCNKCFCEETPCFPCREKAYSDGSRFFEHLPRSEWFEGELVTCPHCENKQGGPCRYRQGDLSMHDCNKCGMPFVARKLVDMKVPF